MLVDPNVSVKRIAVNKILEARKQEQGSNNQGVRIFLKPKRQMINEEASQYYEILLWDRVNGMKNC